jgi:hypothetical protein
MLIGYVVTVQVKYAVHPHRTCSRPHRRRWILPPIPQRAAIRRRHRHHSSCRRYRLHRLHVTATTTANMTVAVIHSVCIVIGTSVLPPQQEAREDSSHRRANRFARRPHGLGSWTT